MSEKQPVKSRLLVAALVIAIVIGVVLAFAKDKDKENKNWRLFGLDYFQGECITGRRVQCSRLMLFGVEVSESCDGQGTVAC